MLALWIILGVLGFFILFVVLPTSIFTVEQQTAAIIQRFGKYKRTVGAGIHIRAPLGIDRIVIRASLRIQQLDLEMESKTNDDVTVKLQLAVQYVIPSIDNVYDAFYKLSDPLKQMDAWVFDVVRAKVPLMQLNDVYENKDDIAKDVEERLKERMQLYGFKIIRALVNDVIPPSRVKEAMNEVNTQQRLQVAAMAEGEKNKILVVKNAEADAESKRLQGEGIAQQRMAIVRGYKESIQDFQKAIPESQTMEIMNMVIVTQYFDTIQSLGKDGVNKVLFMPSNPGAVNQFMQQITESVLAGNEAGKNETKNS